MADDDDVVPMAECPHCQHLVPESNLALHEARCQGRKRPARDMSQSRHSPNENNSTEMNHGNGGVATHHSMRHNPSDEDNDDSSSDDQKMPFLPRARWEAPSGRRQGNRNEITTIDSDDESGGDDIVVSHDSIPAAAAAPPVAAAASAQEVIDLVGDDDAETWSCPRCTLDNAQSSSVCEACSYRRPESERPADPTRRERLIDSPQLGGPGLISGATLLGSILGGTGAYVRGQSLSSGLLNGALTGAVSGAVLHELSRNDPRTANAIQQQQSLFMSSNSAGSPGPTFRAVRVVRTPDGRLSMSQSGNGGGAGLQNPTSPHPDINQIMQLLLAQQLAQRAGGGMAMQANPDQMSYEQLLQMFGTGAENLGAGEGQIRSLPSATIEDVDRLPADSRQCAICLDDFKTGDERKIMPCLHGFHADCVDKWLRTNGSCPMCKHRLDR